MPWRLAALVEDGWPILRTVGGGHRGGPVDRCASRSVRYRAQGKCRNQHGSEAGEASSARQGSRRTFE